MLAPRSISWRGERVPVLLPSLRDPRLHLAAVIISLHVLGQLFLDFELSIAQILVAIATAAVLEIVIVLRERRTLAWPASAMLTGNGVAFILRVNGTEHGDWWSLRGWYIFAAVSALSLLSKHVVRFGGRPLFNPSNLGLVLGFVILGTGIVNPLDFWWGPMSPAMVLVIAIIAVGGLAVTHRVRMLPMSLAFWAAFSASLAVVAGAGHCMSARWSVTPVCGETFWWTLVTSPEVLVFMLFMITDPQTTPTGRKGRLWFGTAVGVLAAVLVAPTTTEFWAKVAVLAALVLVCASRPLLVAALPPGLAQRRALSAGAIALAAAAVLTTSLVTGGRMPATSAADLPPVPAVDIGDPPPVELAAPGALAAGGVTQQSAQQMGEDLLRALIVEAEAIAAGDTETLRAVVAAPRLAESIRRAHAGETAPAAVTVDSWQAVVVRDPLDHQAIPRLGIRLASSGEEDVVYVMVEAGDRFLLSDQLSVEQAALR